MHFALLLALCVTSVSARSLRLVLDSGHTVQQPGALGVRGIYEVNYNDNLVFKLAQALKNAGNTVLLTRADKQSVLSLNDRVKFTIESKGDLFLAIHHDSVQLQYLDKIQVDGRTAFRTKSPITGYSLFVSRLNPNFEKSYGFAKILGTQMSLLGRHPATHHAEPIPGENREFLDPFLGIYRFDKLIVLRNAVIPAVLIEVGVIVDPIDEAHINDQQNQTKIINAIVDAVAIYGVR